MKFPKINLRITHVVTFTAHVFSVKTVLVNVADQVQALNVQKQMTPTEQNEGNRLLFCSEANRKIKLDMEKYRFQLQKEIGRSTVGSVALSSGFPIEMIALVLQHLPELTSVEKVENILPVYSKEMAATIFSIIQKHLATETSTPESP